MEKNLIKNIRTEYLAYNLDTKNSVSGSRIHKIFNSLPDSRKEKCSPRRQRWKRRGALKALIDSWMFHRAYVCSRRKSKRSRPLWNRSRSRACSSKCSRNEKARRRFHYLSAPGHAANPARYAGPHTCFNRGIPRGESCQPLCVFPRIVIPGDEFHRLSLCVSSTLLDRAQSFIRGGLFTRVFRAFYLSWKEETLRAKISRFIFIN